jgi:homospermidine synthase
MKQTDILATVHGRLVIVGFGLIGQGTLPLLLRHIQISPESIVVVTADLEGKQVAESAGVRFIHQPLHRENYREVLAPLLTTPGSVLLNLSVHVSSIALIKLAQEEGVVYLDTCLEPWQGGYTDTSLTVQARSNYAFREAAISLRGAGKPTAVIAHGANPGLVSYLVKQAILNLQSDILGTQISPRNREEWGKLAHKLQLRTIHIAERDTQSANRPKEIDEFVNTWSVDGFIAEGLQPAELGWGTHETDFPQDGLRHDSGCQSAICLNHPGAGTKVRTWTPTSGPIHAYMITHHEAISISDYFTVKGEKGETLYRPSCHYAYHPCNDAVLSLHELAGRQWREQKRFRVMRDEIVSGVDELGVLLAGHERNAYWFGSQLSIEEARRLAPYNSATSLQVCASVLAGMVWALRHPNEGVVEADELDHQWMLETMKPYLGPIRGYYSDWTPLSERDWIFPDDLNPTDPWLFSNVRVR